MVCGWKLQPFKQHTVVFDATVTYQCVYPHKRNKCNLDDRSSRIISSVIIYPVAKSIIEFRCNSVGRRRCLLSGVH